MAGLEFIILHSGSGPVFSSKQVSAVAAVRLQASSQGKRAAWPFAATILCAALLGIGLAFCARTLSPAWGLDGGIAAFLQGDVICSSGRSSTPPQTARMDQ
jgi:hypothetical protein